MTAYDRLLFARAIGLSAALLAVTAAVLVATDEPTSSFGDRAARLAILAPLVSAFSAAILAHSAARRGDTAALLVLGAHPLRAGAGLVLGAMAVGTLGAAALLAPSGSLAALFPMLPSSPWVVSDAAFLAPAAGVSLHGDVAAFGPPVGHSASTPSRAATAAFALVAAALLPPWAVMPGGGPVKALVVVASALAAVVAFHGVAAGASPAVLPLSLVPVLVHAAWMITPRGLLASRP
jgi:uncharacterized membrane protein YqaE (UPF0057 family)